jgi:hypothetical protein
MSQDQSPIDAQSQAICRLRGQLKLKICGDACAECVEGTLLKLLPFLKRALEDKYGSLLDQWLAAGRFNAAQWNAKINLYMCRERLKSLVREVIRHAVSKGEIELSLPPDQSWKPIQIHQLLNSAQEQCDDAIEGLLASLFLAIKSAPTEEAERELIEVVSGRKRLNKRYLRDEAILTVVATEGTPLPVPAKALIELRYRVDNGRFQYAKMMNTEISSVWKEIESLLPWEIAKLIAKDNSF